MAIKFSSEQQLAIDSRNKNIIVSAGAGSGKTAVLTERIRKILLSGVKANELLVLTFTNAAAAEMKERITKAMAKDEILKDRTYEVDSAYITTFDSFSLSLVKKYHDRLNLSKNISIIDASVLNVYKRKIIDEIFDSYYLRNDELFERFICDLTPKDDVNLRKEILKLANKLDLLTNKDELLDFYVKDNFTEEKFNEYLKELVFLLNEKIEFVSNNIKKLEIELTEEQYNKFKVAYQPLIDSKTYDEIRNNAKIKMPIIRNASVNATIYKDEIKKTMEDINKLCIYTNEAYIKEAYFQSEGYVKVTINILKEYYERINKYKKEKESFEFIDISKFAINLVKENKDIQEELKEHFYEILIDEYQDTNDIQEEFISYIAKNNVYMVGDIKQSIYGFRNANPMIFKQKYDDYKENVHGMKIDLNQNFRSNRQVLIAINQIFDHIMDDEIGQANFKKEHQMRFGLTSYDKGTAENKIKYITYPQSKEYKNKDVDMFFVCNDILKKINNKEQVYDKDSGEFRDCTYKDFAILIADGVMFEPLSLLLSHNHIPNLIFKNIDVNKGIIITVLKNIIKLVALDYQRIYDEEFKRCFYGVGRSFIFNLTDEELFDMLTTNIYKESSFYQLIHKYSMMVEGSSLLQLANMIIEENKVINKLINIGDVEDNITRIEFLLKTIESMEKIDLNILDFVTYIDDIFENEDKMEFAASGMSENKVKIMTIHKSKGLEFPIVYFINNDKYFNKGEIKDKILFDNKYGLITPYYIQGEGRNINFILLKERMNSSLISEKIRLLYVALTRAREQMIILNNYKEDDVCLYELEDVVSLIKRKRYNSFSSMYNSIVDVMNQYKEEIDVSLLNINDDYLKSKKKDVKEFVDYVDDKIVYIENKNNSYQVEKTHASKEQNDLIKKETKEIMELGSKVHEAFESANLKNPDYSLFDNKIKEYVKNFLSIDILKDVSKAKVYKEYEFIEETNDEIMYGIIDLMLEYDNHIDIIDYKLSHIDDEAYLIQLNKYRRYIASKTNKKVNIYLYSIMKNIYKKLEEK